MSDWILNTLHFLQFPPGVGIGSGLATGGLGAGIANGIQQREANVFPVLYSGIDRVTEPNNAARFYAACSDMTMAVTEAWNAGRAAKKDEAMLKHLQGGRLTRYGQEDTDHYFTFDRTSASRACAGVDAVLTFDPHAMYEPKLGTFEVEPDTTTGDTGTGGPYRSRGSKAAQVMLDNGPFAFSNLDGALSTIGACTARGELLAKIGRGEFPEDWEPE
ncbi:MAG: hypothetical protein VB934_01575, partial [Polyangiaceae bacterium]